MKRLATVRYWTMLRPEGTGTSRVVAFASAWKTSLAVACRTRIDGRIPLAPGVEMMALTGFPSAFPIASTSSPAVPPRKSRSNVERPPVWLYGLLDAPGIAPGAIRPGVRGCGTCARAEAERASRRRSGFMEGWAFPWEHVGREEIPRRKLKGTRSANVPILGTARIPAECSGRFTRQ